MAKRTPNAAIIAEQWNTGVLPAEVREHVGGGMATKGGGKGGKAGKGEGAGQTKGKERGTRGDDTQQQIAQPTGRVPTRFRLDGNSEEEKEEGDGSSGGAREGEGEEPSEGEEATWAEVLGGKRRKKQGEKEKEHTGSGGKDMDMGGQRAAEPMQIPSQPRKLLAIRQIALQKKKEELQKGKGSGTRPGGPATLEEERGERRLRKVEEELENNRRDLRAAGGANAGNLKVALWHEGRRIQKTQRRLDFLELAIEEDEKAIEEGQQRWREHTSERTEIREVLQKRKERHAHLATELAGEAQADTQGIPGRLEWAMRNVEEAFAAANAEALDVEAIREILIFCRKVVPPQEEIDDEAVLDYLSLETSSSDSPTQAEGGEETPTGEEEGREKAREQMVLHGGVGGQGGASPPETAEGMLEEALANKKEGTDTREANQEGALRLAIAGESQGAIEEKEGRTRSEGAGREGRGRSTGKRQKVTGWSDAQQQPEENCRSCNDVLVGGIGRHACECGAPVCEACDGCNQCLRCLQPPPVRAAQQALAADVRGLRDRLGERGSQGYAKLAEKSVHVTGKGHKNLGRQRNNSRSPRGRSA